MSGYVNASIKKVGIKNDVRVMAKTLDGARSKMPGRTAEPTRSVKCVSMMVRKPGEACVNRGRPPMIPLAGSSANAFAD